MPPLLPLYAEQACPFVLLLIGIQNFVDFSFCFSLPPLRLCGELFQDFYQPWHYFIQIPHNPIITCLEDRCVWVVVYRNNSLSIPYACDMLHLTRDANSYIKFGFNLVA